MNIGFKNRFVRDATLRKYLMGALAPDQQARLESKYFQNKDLLDRLELAEDILIDEYIFGKLSPEDKLLFETNFLVSTRRRGKLKESNRLAQFVRSIGEKPGLLEHPSQRRLVWSLTFSGVAAVFSIILIALLYHRTPANHSGGSDQARPGMASTQVDVIPFVLHTYTRDSQPQPGNLLQIPHGKHTIDIIVFPRNIRFATYRVQCLRGERIIWQSEQKSDREHKLVISVESALLSTGVYFLRVIELDNNKKSVATEEYAFEVVRP